MNHGNLKFSQFTLSRYSTTISLWVIYIQFIRQYLYDVYKLKKQVASTSNLQAKLHRVEALFPRKGAAVVSSIQQWRDVVGSYSMPTRSSLRRARPPPTTWGSTTLCWEWMYMVQISSCWGLALLVQWNDFSKDTSGADSHNFNITF